MTLFVYVSIHNFETVARIQSIRLVDSGRHVTPQIFMFDVIVLL